MSTKYQDSMDQGADNVARLGQEAANRLINHYRNGDGNSGGRNADRNTGSGGEGKPDTRSNDSGASPSESPDGSMPHDPGTELNTNPTGQSRSMGDINPGGSFAGEAPEGAAAAEAAGGVGAAGGAGSAAGAGAEAAAAGSAGEAGSAAAGAGAAGGAAAGGGAAASGAAASGGAAAGGAGAGAAGAGGAAGSTAGAAGGASAGAVGCIVVVIVVAVFFLISLISLLFGLFTYGSGIGSSSTSSSTASSSYSITVDTSALNVREAAGTSYTKIGTVYQGGVYTYLGESRDTAGTLWYKIQYTADKVGWVSSEYSIKSSGTGGNQMVELANSVLVYLGEDYADTVSSAKSDVQSKSSAYGGTISLAGPSNMGGPKGESATSSKLYEYFISDGGVTASFESENGSMEFDVPYVLAAFSVYFEKNNDVIDLSTATTDEIWAEIENRLGDVFGESHSFNVSSETYSYPVKETYTEEVYNEETGEYETVTKTRTVNKSGHYYVYTIQQGTVETLVYEYFKDDFDDADWDLVQTKTTFIAQLLYELGGLCYGSTFETGDVLSEEYGPPTIIDDTGSGKFAWPVPSCTRINSPYGMRWHPIQHKYKMHNGVDIPGAMGSDVISIEAGTVIKTFKTCGHNSSLCSCGGGYGNYVFVQHADGYVSRYCHLKSVYVKVGDSVVRGQVVGTVGSTGQSTGAHLHFEILKNGTRTDPASYY